MQITLDIPDGYFDDTDAADFGRRLKLYAAILMFRDGKLSAGAAATLAGVDRYTFLDEAASHGVPAASYPASELTADAAQFKPTNS